MDLSISRTAVSLPRGSELSTGSWWTSLTSEEKVSTRLTLLCFCWSSGASLSSCGCFISNGSSSSLTASTYLPLPLFLGPLVIPVSVRGDVLGQFSSSSQSPWIPPKIQSLKISTECGINPLYHPL